MTDLKNGRKHLRERNLPGIQRWLDVSRPKPEIRAALLKETLGLGGNPSFLGSWLEASPPLLKSLSRHPLGWQVLEQYYSSLAKPEVWKGTTNEHIEEHLWNLLKVLPRGQQNQAMDSMLAMAIKAKRQNLAQKIEEKLTKVPEQRQAQLAALEMRDYATLERWIEAGKDLCPVTATTALALEIHQPFRNWLESLEQWPGSPEGLFETAVVCGMVKTSTEDRARWGQRLVEWGVQECGMIETKPNNSANFGFFSKLSERDLADRLVNTSLSYNRDVPTQGSIFVMDKQTFVSVKWMEAWPSGSVQKFVALSHLPQKATQSHKKPRL